MKAIHLLLCATMALSSLSCTNYLDIKPYGRTIPKTAEEFSALLHNHLNKIDVGNDRLLVGNASQTLVWDAGCGDDFETCLTEQGGSTLVTYVGNIAGSSNNEYYYRDLYAVIRDCNLVLNEMEEDGTDMAGKVRATAHALRAVAYYQLMRMYCEPPQTGQLATQQGVPLVTVFDMEAEPLRNTLQETIDQIEDDLQKAIGYHNTDDIYRFTEDVCKGYLARLYFWSEQWSRALPLAQELEKKYPLVQGEAYKTMMTTANDLAGNQLLKAYRSNTASSSSELGASSTTMQFRPVSNRLLSLFPEEERAKDVRYALWFNNKRQAIKTFFCGMRSAEFVLIEAECLYHLVLQDEALKSINNLRRHRIEGYTDLTMDNLPPLSSLEIIKVDAEGNPLTPLLGLILSERRKEFFLESDRFFEMKRNGTPEFWTSYNNRKYTTQSFMYTFPIPINDLRIVDGLKQNPGYTNLISQ